MKGNSLMGNVELEPDIETEKEKGTILIVDDDVINRKVLGKIFSEDYIVEEAENGRAALTKIICNRERYCAILLDCIMPEMDGIEVLKRLKAWNLMDKIPVFLITAERVEKVEREAYELGVMDFINKPVVPYVVRRRLNSVIELFQTRKHLNNVVFSQKNELLEQANRIIQLNQGMIEALATAIEFRNEESGGHVQRICKITRYFLENTEFCGGLSSDEINNIALASIMHDIGKIAIPDAILTKPGRFTPEEYEIMKTHTTQGAVILERIPQFRDTGVYDYAWDIAKHHHERWDGKGYPDGLVGEEISPWSQVVSLADVYDALNCKRVYKEAFTRDQVVEMIWTGQCGLFNPHLLDEFFLIEDQLYPMYENLRAEK